MAGENAEGNAGEGKAPDDEDDGTLYYFPGVGCKTKKEAEAYSQLLKMAPVKAGDILEVRIEEMIGPSEGRASVKDEHGRPYPIYVKDSGFGVGDTVKILIMGLGPAHAEAVTWY